MVYNEYGRMRVINDFPNYSISNLGNVMNNKSNKMMKLNVKSGYYHVGLINNKNRSIFKVHRLVALAFIENIENKPEVNHKDGNKLNNSVKNLEFVTNKENQIHKFQSGLGNNYTRKIGQYDLQENIVKEFPSIISAAKELKTSTSNIKGVLYKKRKTAVGFIWKYLEEK